MVGPRSGLTYTHIRTEWAADLADLEIASYPTADPVDLYDAPSIRMLAADFAHGCFCLLYTSPSPRDA